jgi:hypothetical protein
MTPVRLSRLMRAGGVLSMVSGALHLAGSARALVTIHGSFFPKGPYLLFIGFLLISSGLTVAWASGGIRQGARWARGATAIAALQGGGLSAIVAPGFIVHMNVLSVAPVIIVAAHAAFLWLVFRGPAPSA